jgi:hypothetical protein
MLALLVPLTFTGVWIALQQRWPDWGWRRAWLRAAALTSGTLVLLTEGLGLFSAVTRPALAFAWGLAAAAVWFVAARSWARARFPRPRLRMPGTGSEKLVLLAIASIVIITGVTAGFAPPGTWDSLNYHVARVAHWAQDASLRHFATGIEIQNSRPPGAEVSILNLYVLGGGDRLADFVEWAAMIGSLIGVSLLAGQLGGGSRAQLLAAGCAATIPMGIVQASSTMNDYVVAFWCVCAAAEALDLTGQAETRGAVWFGGLAAGLAVYTKPTAVAFLAPFVGLAALELIRRRGWAPALRLGLVAVTVVVLVNAGPWARNLATYGSLSDPADVARHANQWYDPRALLSNVVRNATLHAGTPWPYVNQATGLAVQGLHRLMAVDVNDPRTTAAGDFSIRAPATQEDWVGNPLHAMLGLAALGVVILEGRGAVGRQRNYALAVTLGFVLFAVLYKWLVFGSRLHLPAFVLAAALVGVVLEQRLRPWIGAGLILALVVLAWPWLFSIRTRPLLPRADSVVGSVLSEPRRTLTFANAPYLQDTLASVGGLIREAGCSTVGIALSGNAPEYLLWVVMGAPRPDLQLGWIVAGTPSARYEDPSFAPCAVVCDESCPSDWTTIRGLPLAYERSGYRLFQQAASAP